MLDINKIYCGDCLEVMKEIPENSIDSIVTDPPYGLKFRGKLWDHDVPGIPFWQDVMRISKPGAHMLAFGGTRTHHRLMVAIEDAGWEIRDMMMWVHGQGFPKSFNVSKAIDKEAGVEREVVAYEKKTHLSTQNSNDVWKRPSHYNEDGSPKTIVNITKPTTPESVQWEGWGSALKPAYEPIVLCRKPVEGTIAENVLKWGTGGLNIDGCRIATNELTPRNNSPKPTLFKAHSGYTVPSPLGRFPANLIHDGSQMVLDMFPVNNNCGKFNDKLIIRNKSIFMDSNGSPYAPNNYGDNGSAARFFYCAKAGKAEKAEGNNHPTVKPIALLSYLCRLITPPKGVILDPFAGSGSTGLSAIKEGFNYILIEKSQEYVDIANARLKGVI